MPRAYGPNSCIPVTETCFDHVAEYANLFSGLGTMPGIFSIKLKRETEPLRLYAPRSIAAGLREKAKVELDRMLTMGVIEPVEEPTQWCSGLTIVPKTNGGIRMCVDLTALNRGVKREVYPFPMVGEMLSKLAEEKVFSKLDANSGFWEVRLDPEYETGLLGILSWHFSHCFPPFTMGPHFLLACYWSILYLDLEHY